MLIFLEDTRPETNSSPLKIDGWKMNFLLGWPSLRGLLLLISGKIFITSMIFQLTSAAAWETNSSSARASSSS